VGASMNIELKLWVDQDGATVDNIESTTWELFVNGKPFPNNACNLCNVVDAHSIANRLMDIEEEFSE